MKKIKFSAVLCGLVFGLRVFAAAAVPNIRIGALEIHPFASAEYRYDTNIFLETIRQEHSDHIAAYRTGVGLKMPLSAIRAQDFFIDAKYYADFLNYRRYNNLDRTDHKFQALANFSFADTFTVKAVEKFDKTADPPNTELTQIEKRLRNDASVEAEMKLKQMIAGIGYQHIKDNYENIDALDKYEYIVTPMLGFAISPKTSIFAEYNSGKINYTDDTATNYDSTYEQLRGGIRGQLAPKLTGVIKAGRKTTDYKKDTRNLDKKNFKGGTVFANLAYALQQRSTLNFFGDRSVVESTFEQNNYYRSSTGGASLDHQLMQRVFVFGSGALTVDNYPEESTISSQLKCRKDKLKNITAGMRYEIKEWLSLESSYKLKRKNSNIDQFDYKEHIIAGQLALKY